MEMTWAGMHACKHFCFWACFPWIQSSAKLHTIKEKQMCKPALYHAGLSAFGGGSRPSLIRFAQHGPQKVAKPVPRAGLSNHFQWSWEAWYFRPHWTHGICGVTSVCCAVTSVCFAASSSQEWLEDIVYGTSMQLQKKRSKRWYGGCTALETRDADWAELGRMAKDDVFLS